MTTPSLQWIDTAREAPVAPVPDAHVPGARAMTHSEVRRWLGGNWALYFSHPDDFANYGFEADRWYVELSETLASAGMRVLGPFEELRPSCFGWITEVGGVLTRLSAFLRRAVDVVPGPDTHFVTVLDDELRPRRTFVYRALQSLPSPMDLATAAGVLRQRLTAA